LVAGDAYGADAHQRKRVGQRMAHDSFAAPAAVRGEHAREMRLRRSQRVHHLSEIQHLGAHSERRGGRRRLILRSPERPSLERLKIAILADA